MSLDRASGLPDKTNSVAVSRRVAHETRRRRAVVRTWTQSRPRCVPGTPRSTARQKIRAPDPQPRLLVARCRVARPFALEPWRRQSSAGWARLWPSDALDFPCKGALWTLLCAACFLCRKILVGETGCSARWQRGRILPTVSVLTGSLGIKVGRVLAFFFPPSRLGLAHLLPFTLHSTLCSRVC